VVWTTIAVRRVAVPGHNDFDAHFHSALRDGIKVIYFKPQQHAISVWLVITVCDRAVMVLHFKAVQLKN
jgi:hypothetical protein